MQPRCIELHRVLKDTGSFYYHCDWHADSYVRVMLDQIFGESGFGTNIIWKRTTAKGLAHRSFPNNHDSILYYRKSAQFTFNPQYLPHSQERIEKHYNSIEPGTGRRYTLGDLLNPAKNRPNLTYEFLGMKRVWRWTRERMEKAYAEGRVIQPKPGGVPRIKRYLDEQPGVPVDSVWSDIPPINSQARESVGYPTQKPLPLLERIIKASSNKGDVVLDAFCGCGTTLEAAELLGRSWIGIDISPTACRVMAHRIEERCKLKESEILWNAGRGFVVRNLPWTQDRLREVPPSQFQNWAVNAIGGLSNKNIARDMGIDGKLYIADDVAKRGSGIGKQLEFMYHDYYPIQVKQKDKAGRPDIDSFETAMIRDKKTKGFFISFGFTKDAEIEIRRAKREQSLEIIPITVEEILADDEQRRVG